MSPSIPSASPSRIARPADRAAIIEWATCLGAITAEALADRCEIALVSARARLAAAERARVVRRAKPLSGSPALYAATAAGMRAAGMGELGRCHVSAANAAHLAACAEVAAALERAYPGHAVRGERELRRDERALGRPIASARLRAREAREGVHRPDLVLWPKTGESLPVAVEVELTVKAPRRLEGICRAWARASCVAGVIYLAAPAALRAVERAIERAQASDRVIVVGLETLSSALASGGPESIATRPREPSQARRTVCSGGQ